MYIIQLECPLGVRIWQKEISVRDQHLQKKYVWCNFNTNLYISDKPIKILDLIIRQPSNQSSVCGSALLVTLTLLHQSHMPTANYVLAGHLIILCKTFSLCLTLLLTFNHSSLYSSITTQNIFYYCAIFFIFTYISHLLMLLFCHPLPTTLNTHFISLYLHPIFLFTPVFLLPSFINFENIYQNQVQQLYPNTYMQNCL